MSRPSLNSVCVMVNSNPTRSCVKTSMTVNCSELRLSTEVTVDNRSSEQFTVIDVFTQDRVGLLFTITHTLFRLGLLIHLARISTNADQALDVFYVSDREGRKLTDLAVMRELRETLLLKLAENPEEGQAA